MKFRLFALILLLLILISGCGSGSKVDKNLVAVCMDGFRDYNADCEMVCKSHGGVQSFGLAGAECARNPPPR